MNWLRNARRKKILETPFPAAWEDVLVANVAHYRTLDETERRYLHELTQVFIAEKHWEGCGGLILTDEIRVTIAAQACLMVLGLPHDFFGGVHSIFVYPSTVFAPGRKVGVFEVPQGPIHDGTPILGEAHLRGPLILVWDSVLRNARQPESGHNVVYHEFAHKLDMFDGKADGTPPLEDREEFRRWVEVCSKEFLRLRAHSNAGRRTFLDAYGAVSEAEFFAVSTEEFFDRPVELESHHPELYSVLRKFYRQDPAARSKR